MPGDCPGGGGLGGFGIDWYINQREVYIKCESNVGVQFTRVTDCISMSVIRLLNTN